MRTVFFALSLLILSSCGGNEVKIGNRTTVEFEHVFDAGKVAKGEIIKAKIKLKNTGEYPLVVGDVEVACSCTLASKPNEPIKPGDIGYVEASVDTDKVGFGRFSRDIRIIANTSPSVLTVSIQGEIN
ncbi:MAG: DUF1573 domain-containing protein [Crocinitomicaceae bacterium]|nr:DUF1573 domain-containing protein [Crocinitomicaceae bacterium]